jgi:hypothetical protein
MRTLVVISILALLTISGAAYTDQLMISAQQAAPGADWSRLLEGLEYLWGTMKMLSVDQFLRLISLPAVVAAFLIASQISGTGIFYPAQAQIANQ